MTFSGRGEGRFQALLVRSAEPGNWRSAKCCVVRGSLVAEGRIELLHAIDSRQLIYFIGRPKR
jgi:hypothetical protein